MSLERVPPNMIQTAWWNPDPLSRPIDCRSLEGISRLQRDQYQACKGALSNTRYSCKNPQDSWLELFPEPQGGLAESRSPSASATGPWLQIRKSLLASGAERSKSFS